MSRIFMLLFILTATVTPAAALAPAQQSCGQPETVISPGEVFVGQEFEVRVRHTGRAEDTVWWNGYPDEYHRWQIIDGHRFHTFRIFTGNSGWVEYPATLFDEDRWTWARIRATDAGRVRLFPNWLCGSEQHLLQVTVIIKPRPTVYLPLVAGGPGSFEVPQ